MRVGNWKIVTDHENPWELYDLTTDRSESNNLAAQHPDKVREMEKIWTRHMEEFRAIALRNAPPAKAGKKTKLADDDDD